MSLVLECKVSVKVQLWLCIHNIFHIMATFIIFQNIKIERAYEDICFDATFWQAEATFPQQLKYFSLINF